MDGLSLLVCRGHRWALFALVGAASGCALATLPPGATYECAPDEGFLLLGISTPLVVDGIRITGATEGRFAGPLKDGDFVLAPVRAGRHRLTGVDWGGGCGVHGGGWKPCFQLSMTSTAFDDEGWDLEIAPGRINYVGTLVIEKAGGWRFSLRLANRSSYAAEHLERDYAALIATAPAQYSGFGEDPFLAEVTSRGMGEP